MTPSSSHLSLKKNLEPNYDLLSSMVLVSASAEADAKTDSDGGDPGKQR